MSTRVRVVVLLLVALILLGIAGAIVAYTSDTLFGKEALMPIADKLGVEPTKATVSARITEILEQEVGSDRPVIHEVFNALASCSFYDRYRGYVYYEEVQCRLGELPWKLGYVTSWWTLDYDSESRLISIERVDF